MTYGKSNCGPVNLLSLRPASPYGSDYLHQRLVNFRSKRKAWNKHQRRLIYQRRRQRPAIGDGTVEETTGWGHHDCWGQNSSAMTRRRGHLGQSRDLRRDKALAPSWMRPRRLRRRPKASPRTRRIDGIAVAASWSPRVRVNGAWAQPGRSHGLCLDETRVLPGMRSTALPG